MRVHKVDLEFSQLSKIVNTKGTIGSGELNANIFLFNPRFADQEIELDEIVQAYVNLLIPNKIEPVFIECDFVNDKPYFIPDEEFVDTIGEYKGELVLIFTENRKMVSPIFKFSVVKSIEQG